MNKNNILINHNLDIDDYKIEIKKFFNKNSFNQGSNNNKFRDKLIKYLKKKKIDSTIGSYSLSKSEFYKKKYSKPETNSLYLFKIE